ncbi:MAG: SAM-dependent methyltransferase [Bacteroidetes bacterium MedPE-SWsnd-G2]|nr:MAG: SAM-dependent methyltransferase [Bacteroidetes bacterium MedPE-SWsnd-G2]
MYRQLKSVVKFLLPDRFIASNEVVFRRIYALIYKGSLYKCNLCDTGLRLFINDDRGGKLCPKCGSISRNRRLWNVLKSDFITTDSKILHFSPSRALNRKLSNISNIDYVTSDFVGEFQADKNLDITAIEEADNCYNTIICYHILEHITEDHTAISELYRILKPGGTCILQTPFKDGDIYEDPKIVTPEDRSLHFGQDDHVRVYSVEGLQNRLEQKGFQVSCLKFENDKKNKYGLATPEYILLAKKPIKEA